MDSLQSGLINGLFVYFAIRGCIITLAPLIMPVTSCMKKQNVGISTQQQITNFSVNCSIEISMEAPAGWGELF